MYSTLLPIHSLFRWLVLISLLISIIRAYQGWKRNKSFTKLDNSIRLATVSIIHIQALFGLWLYFISPLVQYFLAHPAEAIHERDLRFFGLEHITVMSVAVIVVTIGSAKAKRKITDNEKFKTMALWFAIGLFLILTSIPWEFSPFTTRPHFRGF